MLVLRTELKLYDNANCLFYDRTGTTAANSYGDGSNITYADVDAIRIKIANYTTLSNLAELNSADAFVQYKEYVKTGGEVSTIDGKDFIIGTYFVPQLDSFVVPTDDVWEETGYYVYPYLATWLPTISETSLNISLTELNQEANTNISQDIYAYEYEVYKDSFGTTTPAVDGNQYIVISGTATYNGDTYRAGEIFVASGTTNIVPTSSVAIMDATTYSYACLLYDIESGLVNLTEQQFGKNNQDLINPTETELVKLRMKVEALNYAAFTRNVSLRYCSETILAVQNRITLLSQ